MWCLMSETDGDLLHCINALTDHVLSPSVLRSRALSQSDQLRSQTRSESKRLVLSATTCPLHSSKQQQQQQRTVYKLFRIQVRH